MDTKDNYVHVDIKLDDLKTFLTFAIPNVTLNQEQLDYIINNITMCVLDNEDLSGTRGECYDEAVSILVTFGISDSDSNKICTDILDLLISKVTAHIPDYDHRKYNNNLDYSFIGEDYVRITINKKVINT
jgi:hypothetical protein